MDAKTRVRICKLSERLDKHPELTKRLGIKTQVVIKERRLLK